MAAPILWQATATYLAPLWTHMPDIAAIETISRRHLLHQTDANTQLTITYLTEGSFNKIYTVDVKVPSLTRSYIFRVSLPVEPRDKTKSEVATLNYIKRRTTIPVPAIIACDPSSDNELGFEWILMDKVPGTQLSDLWAGLSDDSKVSITRQIAAYISQLRERCVFHEIGGLYQDDKEGFAIGPIVTQLMFAGARRQSLSRNRGPYRRDSDFVSALIDVEIADILSLESLSPDDPNFDEDLAQDGPDIVRVMNEMITLIPLLFSEENSSMEQTVLLHPDLSLKNILVDSASLEITGIIDWECTNASPLWQDTYPQFLAGPEVKEEAPRVEPGDTDALRNELWDNWEKAQLRITFDEVVGRPEKDRLAKFKREFVYHIGFVEYSQIEVERWMRLARAELVI